MKKLILIAIALISIGSFAQQIMEGPNRKYMAKKMSSLTPEETAGLQTKRMTLFLDLNQAQQKEIYNINLENTSKRKNMMANLKAKRESGNMERPSKEDRLKMMNERLDHQIAIKAKMKSILNADQYTKWQKGQEEMKHKFKDGMKSNRRFAQNDAPFNKRRF